MKIITQTADEMVLKEGGAGGMILGVILALGGIFFTYHMYSASGWSNSIWIPIIVFLVEIIMIFSSSSIKVDVNKAGNQIIYQKKRLFGGKSASYAVADVFRVETRRQWQTQGGGGVNNRASMPQQVLMSRSVIVFKDGQELPIDHQKNASSVSVGGIGLGGGNEVAIANQLATFMGVPYQEIAPPGGPMNINIGGTGIKL